MRLAIVVHVTGTLVRLYSPALIAPALVGMLYGELRDAALFLATAAGTIIVGAVMRRASRGEQAQIERLRRVEGLAIVAATWMVIAQISAVPYMWSRLGYVDALFESMSGLTTTGATVFTDFTAYSHSIFFWRALTHWLGGLGVIALFIAVLPRRASTARGRRGSRPRRRGLAGRPCR